MEGAFVVSTSSLAEEMDTGEVEKGGGTLG